MKKNKTPKEANPKNTKLNINELSTKLKNLEINKLDSNNLLIKKEKNKKDEQIITTTINENHTQNDLIEQININEKIKVKNWINEFYNNLNIYLDDCNYPTSNENSINNENLSNNSEKEKISINNNYNKNLELNNNTEYNVNYIENEKEILEKSLKDINNIYYKINSNFFEKDDTKIIDKYILNKDNDSFIFDGKMFKYYNRENIYKRKDKIKRKIYKCIHYRKNQKIQKELKTNKFCNATIIYIEPNQTKNEGK